MDEKGDIHVGNIFYTLLEDIHSYRKIKNELTIIDKINPITMYKFRLLRQKLEQKINNQINGIEISVKMILDFEIMYIANMDYIKIPSIELEDNESPYGSVFYKIIFQHIYSVDIVSNTILIKNNMLHANYNYGDIIREDNTEIKEVCNAIRLCILEYFTKFLSL